MPYLTMQLPGSDNRFSTRTSNLSTLKITVTKRQVFAGLSQSLLCYPFCLFGYLYPPLRRQIMAWCSYHGFPPLAPMEQKWFSPGAAIYGECQPGVGRPIG